MQKEQGFTLIELMIVLAIMGILLAISIPKYASYVASSQAENVAQEFHQQVENVAVAEARAQGGIPRTYQSPVIAAAGGYQIRIKPVTIPSQGTAAVVIAVPEKGTGKIVKTDFQRDVIIMVENDWRGNIPNPSSVCDSSGKCKVTVSPNGEIN